MPISNSFIKLINLEKWYPWVYPDTWGMLPAHLDSRGGIERLRKKNLVVTCSNNPLALQAMQCRSNKIVFDALIPLESIQVYKPHSPEAYMLPYTMMGLSKEDVIHVTANKEFGDLEMCHKLGIKTEFIDRLNHYKGVHPRTLVELAEKYGC
jgi:FMN phosphatase YigB (HAD superfamily)